MKDDSLYVRYEKMEDLAGEQMWASDFREEIAESFKYALQDGKKNITLEEFLIEIEKDFWVKQEKFKNGNK